MPIKTHVQTRINGEDVEFLCEPRQSPPRVPQGRHRTDRRQGRL